MELHTLGVDGGYTQKDVTEVARAFTGWTIDNPRQGGGFTFDPRIHDAGREGRARPRDQGGRRRGRRRAGARHPRERIPSTARFIATKLARRFVSDTPPPALVDRAAARFRETDGDLREVMRTILTSPEFLAPERTAPRSRRRSSSSSARCARSAPTCRTRCRSSVQLQQLGMPLYQCQPPTGYKDTADAWVNTGALVSRMNFALTLAGNKLRGVSAASLPTADADARRRPVGDDARDDREGDDAHRWRR